MLKVNPLQAIGVVFLGFLAFTIAASPSLLPAGTINNAAAGPSLKALALEDGFGKQFATPLKLKRAPSEALAAISLKAFKAAPTGYSLEFSNASRQMLVQEVLRMYSLSGVSPTSAQVDSLNSKASSLSEGVAQGLSLVVKAVNDAHELNSQATAKLSAQDRQVLASIFKKFDSGQQLSQTELEALGELRLRVDSAKQLQAAFNVSTALEAAKNSLPLSPQPTAVGSSVCTPSGLVLFEDPLCLVVVGSDGSNTYNREHKVIVDIGGNDTYDNSAAGAIQTVKAVLDLAGVDNYPCGQRTETVADGTTLNLNQERCHGYGELGVGVLFDAGDGGDSFSCSNSSCQGMGKLGVGLLADFSGNSSYQCTRLCQGSGFGNGFGVLVDYAGDDSRTCTPASNLAAFCQGSAALGGNGVLLDYSGADSYDCGNGFCQAASYSEALPANTNLPAIGAEQLGVLVDYDGADSYACGDENNPKDNCQASSIVYGSAALLDYAGNDSYLCGSNCQASTRTSSAGAQEVPSISALLAEYAGDDALACGNYCQGSSQGSTGVAALADFGGTETAACGEHCQGFASQGLGALVDSTAGNSYSCAGDCQGVGTVGVFVTGEDVPPVGGLTALGPLESSLKGFQWNLTVLVVGALLVVVGLEIRTLKELRGAGKALKKKAFSFF